jgi:nicotinamidase-related amidase
MRKIDLDTFIADSRPFIEWMVDWYNTLETIELDKLAGDPNKIAIIAVDILEGFCNQGQLASPRVAAIVPPVVELLQAAWRDGVRNIVLTQDAHAVDAIEFTQWGPHCIRGTREADTVDAIADLPFYDELLIFEKNSISSSIDTGLDEWLDEHPEIATFIVVGDWTDLSAHQLAMHLKLRVNSRQLGGVRVIVPAIGVATFDLPVDAAEARDLVPHDGNFMHLVSLFSMMQNGITIIRQIALST